MGLKLSISDLDNDAFQPDPRPELQRLLTQAALRVANASLEGDDGRLMDANGNHVGTWIYDPDV
jgi:hypothetical protein